MSRGHQNLAVQGNIRTATESLAGTILDNTVAYMTMQPYALFPMIHTTQQDKMWIATHNVDGADPDLPRMGIRNGGSGFTQSYDIDYRYIDE